MKNRDLILMLINNSSNAFGELIGLSEYAKLKVAQIVIKDTIKTTFNINVNKLTTKELSDILLKNLIDIDQIRILTELIWIQGEIALKLKEPLASLTNYENALQLLQWQQQHGTERIHLEKQNKIIKLKAIIKRLNHKTSMGNTINKHVAVVRGPDLLQNLAAIEISPIG